MRCTTGYYFRTIDVPYLCQRHASGYADDSCLMYQHRDVEKTEKQLNKDFENDCDSFADN